MSVLNNEFRVTMPDNSIWAVPVMIIAKHRAANYAKEFNGELLESLKIDTKPLFEDDEYEIENWATNNMNWSDVADSAKLIKQGESDYQEGWMNGKKSVS